MANKFEGELENETEELLWIFGSVSSCCLPILNQFWAGFLSIEVVSAVKTESLRWSS